MQTVSMYLNCGAITEADCELTIEGSPDEVEQSALEHLIAAHGLSDSPHLRIEVRAALEMPPPLVPTAGRVILDVHDLPRGEPCTLSFTGPPGEVAHAAFSHEVRAHRRAPTIELEDEIRLSLRAEVPATYSAGV